MRQPIILLKDQESGRWHVCRQVEQLYNGYTQGLDIRTGEVVFGYQLQRRKAQ